jgi:hypothetical protein
MDLSLLGRPEFVAPISGLVGALIGSSITALTTRSVHRERLAAEQKLAERKYEFDNDLAEKRLAYDKALVVWQRRLGYTSGCDRQEARRRDYADRGNLPACSI